MRKIGIFLLAMVLFVSIASAFSFAEILDDLDEFITGRAVDNEEPRVYLNAPTDGQVVNGFIEFRWHYFDPEDDELIYSVLQIDDSRNFNSPTNYHVLGTSHKLRLNKEGTYHWRVQVVNDYGSKISESWSFYYNPKAKLCKDGTPYYECSGLKPQYCSGGVLRNDCVRCGCPSGGICQEDGSCVIQTCIDGTVYNECSVNKPWFCLDGELKEVCSICGCDEGYECKSDGTCERIIPVVYEPPKPKIKRELSLIEKIANFFKKLFTGKGLYD